MEPERKGSDLTRPVKKRIISGSPEIRDFHPESFRNVESVRMTYEEFETIRQLDYNGRTQEECAQTMGVSRTTVTNIYKTARAKIADCLVNGYKLVINGGNYVLKEGNKEKDPNPYKKYKEAGIMRIAVTYDNGEVFQHFGRTEHFKIYDVKDADVVSSEEIDNGGMSHEDLINLLTGYQVDTLICGGIGAGAQNKLSDAGIKLYGGISGSVDEAVCMLLEGKLVQNQGDGCDHHKDHDCDNKESC